MRTSQPGLMALAVCLVSGVVSRELVSRDIPVEESITLANIVEDEPSSVSIMKEDWESPPYSLIYRNPLPIPPQKQPKM